jgi:Cu+-exporting ATPase
MSPRSVRHHAASSKRPPPALGNSALMRDLSIALDAVLAEAEALRGSGQTVMFVAIDGRIAGLVGVADPIKPSTPEALRLRRIEL